jgi:hypothetical protein
MGARTEEMDSETLGPLPDLRTRALVSNVKNFLIERNGASVGVDALVFPKLLDYGQRR